MVVDEWIVDVISFQKIFGLCGLNGHIMEIRLGVTLEDNGRTTDNGQRTTECEDRARILETEFGISKMIKFGKIYLVYKTYY